MTARIRVQQVLRNPLEARRVLPSYTERNSRPAANLSAVAPHPRAPTILGRRPEYAGDDKRQDAAQLTPTSHPPETQSLPLEAQGAEPLGFNVVRQGTSNRGEEERSRCPGKEAQTCQVLDGVPARLATLYESPDQHAATARGEDQGRSIEGLPRSRVSGRRRRVPIAPMTHSPG